MKNYNDVVLERYDKEVAAELPSSGMQKVYTYILSHLKGCISEVIEIATKRGGKITELTVLDIGCGDGKLMECWQEYGILQKNLTGVDLSSKRIEKAKNNLPDAQFSVGDIVNFELNEQFDIVVAFDIFSHLNTEEEILKAMDSVKKRLKPNGIFVWYDICSKDHFDSPDNVDSYGFNPTQFQEYLKKGGFQIVHRKNVFKNFFYRYQSMYQVRRIPAFLVRFAEMVIPGPPGNIMFISEKIK